MGVHGTDSSEPNHRWQFTCDPPRLDVNRARRRATLGRLGERILSHTIAASQTLL